MPTVKAAKPTEDPISGFFDALAGRGHEPTFGEDSATLRFDVGDGTRIERWYLTVTGGDVSVTRQNIRADTIVRVQRSDFEAMVTGRLNVMAALLRGAIAYEGSAAPLMMFQRSLPSPPGSKGRVPPISGGAVMAQRTAT
ncbi:MAG TPA: SCP2 sterol-binding domain-containing protein [Acidimicrobiales bacterium]|nr:SCP2 sterol-binding domain-containing protein [Acidimicrobiales bacterium]